MEFEKCHEGRKMIRTIIFIIIFMNSLFFIGWGAQIKVDLISPTEKVVITRHPQIILKYHADVKPILMVDSIRFTINNVDYTNYIRLDLTTPEMLVYFFTTKPLSLGKNVVKVSGKLINDEPFENVFTFEVNPRYSNDVKYYLDLINKSNDLAKKSELYYKLGKYYESKGYSLDALGYYDQAAKLDKSNIKAKEDYKRLLSLFPNKAVKALNIVLDVSLVNLDVLKRNNIVIFRCIVENYRSEKIEFNLNNFLLVSGNDYYQPIGDPYGYLRNITQKKIITIEDFAIANYLLSKEVYNFVYSDNFVLDSFSQMKIDLMFHLRKESKDLVFQFFKVKEGKKKELPLYLKVPFYM